MIGRLLNTIVNILFLTYVILLISFFFLHETLKSNVNEINNSVLDSVATTGVFTEDMYVYLKQQVLKYSAGDTFQVVVKYEKKIKPGVYETFWKRDWIAPDNLSNKGKDEILTVIGRPIPMHIGDKLSIYLENQNHSLFEKLLSAPFLGLTGSFIDMRIKAMRTVTIGKNAQSIVKGYELKAELAQKNNAAWANGIGNPVKIIVKTEMHVKAGGVGYEYSSTNTTYGNDASEQYIGSTLGQNYIFDTAEFYRQVTEYDPMPNTLPAGRTMADYERVIEFTQK